jgi:hypothetical protein
LDAFLDSLTGGHVTAVKVVLASVTLALACYQLVVIAVAYGKLRVGFLSRAPAFGAHRAVGDTTAVILLIVAAMCISEYGFEAEDHGEGNATLHVITGSALVLVLALKVAVLRWWHGLGRLLPLLGTTVFVLLGVAWLTSAGGILR